MSELPLEIKKAVFITSMKRAQDYPDDGIPEIAIAGKSNVGKSSLINYLANHSKLAYVSKQPGKTRLINYFLMNESFYLVDLPGYGFARVSKKEKQSWATMMQAYFDVAKHLLLLAILVDIRHNPTADDIQMVSWAHHFGVPFVLIATKADKIAKSKRINYIRSIKKYVAEQLDLELEPDVLVVSALEKRGKDEVLAYMSHSLEG